MWIPKKTITLHGHLNAITIQATISLAVLNNNYFTWQDSFSSSSDAWHWESLLYGLQE